MQVPKLLMKKSRIITSQKARHTIATIGAFRPTPSFQTTTSTISSRGIPKWRTSKSIPTVNHSRLSTATNFGNTAKEAATNAKTATAQALAAGQTPPLLVRTFLVAATTAVATPAFPVVGFLNFGLRYLVWDRPTRMAVLGATTAVGAVGTLMTIAANDLLPVAYSYGQLFLPFAIVNGGVAGTMYMCLDLALGTAKVASWPLTGAIIGGAVGFLGPATGLYDAAFQWCYDIPEADGLFNFLLGNGFVLPISATTGAAVGFVIHPLLYYPIVGLPGIHWAKFSAPLLAGATAVMLHLYFADYYDSKIFPPETYLTLDEKRGLNLVSRLHAKQLRVEDWGPNVGWEPSGTGTLARDSVRDKLQEAKFGSNRTDKVFDSRRKAWLHYVTNGLFAVGAVETIPTQTEVNRQSQKYLYSDGAVAFIMLQGGELRKNNSEDVSSLARKGLMQLAHDLQASQRRYKQDSHRAKRTLDRIEAASHGIALLLSHRMMEEPKGGNRDTTDIEGIQRERELNTLERNIRKLVPGILLNSKDEEDNTRGCSVESQLRELGWEGVGDKELERQLSRKWKSGYNEFVAKEQNNQIAWAVTGLSMVLIFGLFGSRQ